MKTDAKWRCRKCKQDMLGLERISYSCSHCGNAQLMPRNLEAYIQLSPWLFVDDNDMENAQRLLRRWFDLPRRGHAKLMDLSIDITDLDNYLRHAIGNGALLGEHVLLYGAGLFELGVEVMI